MALKKSTRKSPLSARNNLGGKKELITLENILDLPDGTGFESKQVRVGLDAMIRRCEELLPIFNSRPGAEEERLRDKCDVEFVL
jgi:hypothetical protein